MKHLSRLLPLQPSRLAFAGAPKPEIPRALLEVVLQHLTISVPGPRFYKNDLLDGWPAWGPLERLG